MRFMVALACLNYLIKDGDKNDAFKRSGMFIVSFFAILLALACDVKELVR